jgi:hypothetical protein
MPVVTCTKMRGGVKSLPASEHQSFCHNFPQLSSKEEQGGGEHGTTMYIHGTEEYAFLSSEFAF